MRDGPKPSYYYATFRSIPGDYRIHFCPQSRRVTGIFSLTKREWIPETSWKKSMPLLKFRAHEPNHDVVFAETYISTDHYLVEIPFELSLDVDHHQVRRLKTFENINTAIQFASI